MMPYKEDWESAQERLTAWFAGEDIGRPALMVMAPKDGPRPANEWNWWYLVHHLEEPDRVIDEFEKSAAGTYFGGEAVPSMPIYLGAGSVAAYLGCDVTIAPDTIWFEPKEGWSWERILGVRRDPANTWWQAALRMTELAVERSRGGYLVQIGDLGAPMNVLGSLRGTQALLMDLIDQPDKVKEGANRILDHVMHYYDASLPVTQRYRPGSITWMGIWFPGRGSDVQCDFSAMISPKQFEEFVVPHLQEQCRRLEHTIYHWDGPGQVPHFEHLLDIPELTGLQWTPGAGREGVGSPRWFPFYKRMQEKGKRVVLLGIGANEIEPFLRELSHEGVLMVTYARSESEARELLRKTEQWSAGRG